MAKKKEDTNRDELTGILAASLNKKFSKITFVYLLKAKIINPF